MDMVAPCASMVCNEGHASDVLTEESHEGVHEVGGHLTRADIGYWL